jgi:prepilin-type N-terminal cleavage/methylation domain-containing protein
MQIANCKVQIENCRNSTVGRVRDASIPPQLQICNLQFAICNLRHRRRGVTLVELLITMTIISILAGLILGVASVAGEKARENQTRHVVQRIHQLLMERYDSYKTRRVRLSNSAQQQLDLAFKNRPAAQQGKAIAEARLYAMREMMLMEMPDRWSDVYLADLETASVPGQPIYLAGTDGRPARTELANVYLRRLLTIMNGANPPDVDTLLENQGAECLYLVVTLATGDGEARGFFGENSIGDTDEDGALEFLDGWGNPISYLRWAPGLDSLIQLDANDFALSAGNPVDNPAWIQAATGDHDPFDMFRVDPAAFRLLPLVFSPGGDETYGFHLMESYVTWFPIGAPAAGRIANRPLLPRLSPYYRVQDPDDTSVREFLGTPGEGATDNIHNHLLGLRGRP